MLCFLSGTGEALERELLRDLVVVAVDREEVRDQHRDEDDDDPRPSRNFVIATTNSTISVSVAPSPLTNAPRRQPGFRSRRHLMTMPACDSVNDTKTPSM